MIVEDYGFINDLLIFAGPHAPITAEGNEERIEQLLVWIEGLEETPWEEGEEPPVSMEQAKELVSDIRMLQAEAEAEPSSEE